MLGADNVGFRYGLPELYRLLDTWPSKMGPIVSPETSVLNQPTLRKIPEDRI
jgi:hypothetical protein